MMMNRNKMKQYQAVGVETSIMDADPHRLIELLFRGALDSLSAAMGCIERGEIEQRNIHLNKAIQIVGGLRNFLDIEQGGELAQNLDKLYDYIEFRLFKANVHQDSDMVKECIDLLKSMSSAWTEIRPQVNDAQEGTPAAEPSL